MKLLSVMRDGVPRPGLRLSDTQILDLSIAFPLAVRKNLITAKGQANCSDILWLIRREAEDEIPYSRMLLEAGRTGLLDEAVMHAGLSILLHPLFGQRKSAFCVGRNYMEHVEEGAKMREEAANLPEWPTFFSKPSTAFVGPDNIVYFPRELSDSMDYEVELGVVIGKGGKNIPEEQAMNHVFGYTIVNDISARDLQWRHGQWFKGKSLDMSCAIGPWIVHKDSIPDPHSLNISLHVNSEKRQDSNTSQMIFKIPQIIASLSSGMTLEPGDLIATGTPAGVGFASTPPKYLRNGDGIRCEIEGIGRLYSFFQSAEE